MPLVLVKETLSVPSDRVWALVCDVRSYPKFMDSVIATTVLEEETRPDGVIEALVAWEVELKGSILRWTEREWRDEDARRIAYEQVSGDLARFDGAWEVVAVDDETTEASLEVNFEIGIEMLRPMLEPVAVRAIQRNSAEMLQSLGRTE